MTPVDSFSERMALHLVSVMYKVAGEEVLLSEISEGHHMLVVRPVPPPLLQLGCVSAAPLPAMVEMSQLASILRIRSLLVSVT
jgi:hypothetical protein